MENYKSIRTKINQNDQSLQSKAFLIIQLNKVYSKWHVDLPNPRTEIKQYEDEFCDDYTFMVTVRSFDFGDISELISVKVEYSDLAEAMCKEIVYLKHEKGSVIIKAEVQDILSK